MEKIKLKIMSVSHFARNGECGEKSPGGWRKFKWDYKRFPLYKVVWEVYENGASGKSGANLPWVWQIFKVDAKSGPLERGDYDENGEPDENSESPDLLAIAEMASLVKNGQRVGEKLNNLWEGLWFWRKRHISCVLIHPTFSCRRPNRSTLVT